MTTKASKTTKTIKSTKSKAKNKKRVINVDSVGIEKFKSTKGEIKFRVKGIDELKKKSLDSFTEARDLALNYLATNLTDGKTFGLSFPVRIRSNFDY